MPLEYRQLGRSELRVSSIGLGCVTFGREISAEASFAVLDGAMQRGVTLLDTAAVYGDGASETIIGQWLRQRNQRSSIVLATKVSGSLTRDSILRSVDGSLRRLGIERVDLLQAHSHDPGTPLTETLSAFDHLVRQGKARHIGVSNWPPQVLRESLALAEQNHWQRPESVQPIYNLVDRGIERELLPLCAQHNLGVISYSPLGAGFLTGKYGPDTPVPEGTRFDIKPGHQNIYFTPHGFDVVDLLRRAASAQQCPMPQLALAWVLHRPGITSVLIGARTPEQVDQAFESLHVELPEEMYGQLATRRMTF